MASTDRDPCLVSGFLIIAIFGFGLFATVFLTDVYTKPAPEEAIGGWFCVAAVGCLGLVLAFIWIRKCIRTDSVAPYIQL